MNHYIRRFENGFLPYPGTSYASWCVIRQLPTLQSIVVGRFLSRMEAETHLDFMRHLYPGAFFEVMFDAPFE